MPDGRTSPSGATQRFQAVSLPPSPLDGSLSPSGGRFLFTIYDLQFTIELRNWGIVNPISPCPNPPIPKSNRKSQIVNRKSNFPLPKFANPPNPIEESKNRKIPEIPPCASAGKYGILCTRSPDEARVLRKQALEARPRKGAAGAEAEAKARRKRRTPRKGRGTKRRRNARAERKTQLDNFFF